MFVVLKKGSSVKTNNVITSLYSKCDLYCVTNSFMWVIVSGFIGHHPSGTDQLFGAEINQV